MMQVV
jgi:hypothetical protein